MRVHSFLAAFDMDYDGLGDDDFPYLLAAYDHNKDGALGADELTSFVARAESLGGAFIKVRFPLLCHGHGPGCSVHLGEYVPGTCLSVATWNDWQVCIIIVVVAVVIARPTVTSPCT